jgi:hypothetical protein
MTRKFSLDLEDLYINKEKVTRLTVYHDDDILEEIVDETGIIWPITELSERDQDKVYTSLIQEVQANREMGRE